MDKQKSNFRIKNIYFKKINHFDVEMNCLIKKKKFWKIWNTFDRSSNIKNAIAAIAVSYFIGISKILRDSLKNFKGGEKI